MLNATCCLDLFKIIAVLRWVLKEEFCEACRIQSLMTEKEDRRLDGNGISALSEENNPYMHKMGAEQVRHILRSSLAVGT